MFSDTNVSYNVIKRQNEAYHDIVFSVPNSYSKDVAQYITAFRSDVKKIILQNLVDRQLYSAKMFMVADINVEKKLTSASEAEISFFHINTGSVIITRDEIGSFLDECMRKSEIHIEEHEGKLEGSGWSVIGVNKLTFTILRIERGPIGSYKPYPEKARGGRFLYNPDVGTNCVLTALAAHAYFKEHPTTKQFTVTRKIKREGDRFVKS